MISLNDTIVAISTGMATGGIGIVRLSGSESWEIANRCFSAADHLKKPILRSANETPHRKMIYGHIHDPQTGTVIDEVLATFMSGPRTYSGEDTVEFNTHGGRSVLMRVIELAIDGGARMADPGEFTRRAYLNGRIDLTQAEAVIDLINAKSDLARQRAVGLLQGGLRDLVAESRDALLSVKVRIAAGIDFPDDVEDSFDSEAEAAQLNANVIDRLKPACGRYRHTRVLTEGLRVAIIGRPNVGKSSLLNALTQRDRAIVSESPGTTRDTIEEAVDVGGIPVVFIDTAGLRSTDDPIEQLGMERSLMAVEDAQLVLFLIDAQTGFCEEDAPYMDSINPKEGMLVVNKIDLMANPPDDLPPWQTLFLSAKTREGIDRLESAICNFAIQEPLDAGEIAISPNLRQTKALETAIRATELAVDGLKAGKPEMIIDIDLTQSLEALDAILGEDVNTDVLDEIFSRFCIGK